MGLCTSLRAAFQLLASPLLLYGEGAMNDILSGELSLPILPLRNSVLFPASVVPVNVARKRSIRLVEFLESNERGVLFAVAQRDPTVEDPTISDLYEVGTIARILKIIRLGSRSYSIVLQGMSRARRIEEISTQPFLSGKVAALEPTDTPEEHANAQELLLPLRELAQAYFRELPAPRRDTQNILENVQEIGAMSDLIASNLPVPISEKQSILEELSAFARARRVFALVERRGEVERVRKEIGAMVEDELSRSQRELILRQQLKAIRQELGENDGEEEELEQLRDRVAQAKLPPEAESAARRELRRMSAMSPASAEYQVARNYVEWILDLPFGVYTPDKLDTATVRRVLDEDHYGLERPKKRVVEQIAVRKLRRDGRAPILCLIGPPGVGKTSLARSIARATGRSFARIALGGVNDEAEIRGHRRTYIGALPGRVVAAMKKAGSMNPVIVLDEVDKLGSGRRGDPSSALLEVLDPEQNREFHDHYLDIPLDLSQVMFIATANTARTIPWALYDRMEVLELPGYTRDEQLAIARDFVAPRQLEEHGLSPVQLDITDEALNELIENYTNELGVRKLDRQIAALCRAVAVDIAEGKTEPVRADREFVRKILGPPTARTERPERSHRPGIATGLSYTPLGGKIMVVEASQMPGKGRFHLTGKTGDVLKESFATAMSYLRSRPADFGLPADFLSTIDVHVHLPEGATPKEGTSAGLPIAIAVASLLTRNPVRGDLGLVGELTLRGNILPAPNIKERCLGAHYAGIKEVVLPERNRPDLDELPDHVRDALRFHFVSHIREVFPIVFDGDGDGVNESISA